MTPAGARTVRAVRTRPGTSPRPRARRRAPPARPAAPASGPGSPAAPEPDSGAVLHRCRRRARSPVAYDRLPLVRRDLSEPESEAITYAEATDVNFRYTPAGYAGPDGSGAVMHGQPRNAALAPTASKASSVWWARRPGGRPLRGPRAPEQCQFQQIGRGRPVCGPGQLLGRAVHPAQVDAVAVRGPSAIAPQPRGEPCGLRPGRRGQDDARRPHLLRAERSGGEPR